MRTRPVNQVVQDQAVQPQDGARGGDVADHAIDLAGLDHLPAILKPVDMQRIFSMKHSKFYQLVKQGAFDRFEDKSFVGVRRWSGALVARHLKAGGRQAFVFGRKLSA